MASRTFLWLGLFAVLPLVISSSACRTRGVAGTGNDAAAQLDATKQKASDKARKTGEVCTVENDGVLPACRCQPPAAAMGSEMPPPEPRRPD